MLPLSHDLSLTNRCQEIGAQSLLADLIRLSVKIFILQEYNNLFWSNCSLQKSLVILSIVGSNCDESWNIWIPRSETLRVLGGHSSCWTIEASEDYSSTELTSTHVMELGWTIDDMVDRLKSKVHRHELHDRSESHESSSAADTSEATFCDGSVP